MAELQPRRPEKTLEDTGRRISRLILELAERHDRHIREGKVLYTESPYALLFRLTAGNADAMEALLDAEPLFFETHPEVPPVILLDEAVSSYFPKEFFDDPTSFIEGQVEVDRGAGRIPRAETNRRLMDIAYDVTQVKSFNLPGPDESVLSVVSRRIDRKALSSVNRQRAAFDAGIPTPRVYGEVLHGENQYALFEKVRGVTVLDAIARRFQRTEDYDNLLRAPLSFQAVMSGIMFYFPETQNNDLQKRCQDVANKYQEVLDYHFFCSKLYIYISDVIDGPGSYLRHVNIFGGKEFVDKCILQVARTLGIDSIEDFFNRYRFASPHWESQWEKDAVLIQEDADAKIVSYKKEWAQVVDVHFFGFPLTARRESLKKMAEERGVPHKDFASRNTMIEWDFNADKPLVRDGEVEPRLLLIDWEE